MTVPLHCTLQPLVPENHELMARCSIAHGVFISFLLSLLLVAQPAIYRISWCHSALEQMKTAKAGWRLLSSSSANLPLCMAVAVMLACGDRCVPAGCCSRGTQAQWSGCLSAHQPAI